jgi:hypothetical protein
MQSAITAILIICTQLAGLSHSRPVAPNCTQQITPAPPRTSQPLFSIHSGIWINLHHFLYYQGLLKAHSGGRSSRNTDPKDTAQLDNLNPTERERWQKAIDYYAKNLVGKDLLFDTIMVNAKNYLEDQEGQPQLTGAALPAEWRNILNELKTSYLQHFWAKQNAINQRWIQQTKPLLQKYSAALASELAKYYLSPWPKDSIRLDVTNYASWSAAYTSLYPNRITISSADSANQGPAALEVVFHEASHIIIDSLSNQIDTIAKRDHRVLPNTALWHALLFYTTGAIVKRTLGAYTPYAYQNGLWKRAWPMYIDALEKDWQPYLDDHASLETALTSLIRDVSKEGNPS